MKRDHILYPILLKVSEIPATQFWKDIFIDLSYGICPLGTFLDRGMLCCRNKGKHFNVSLQGKSPQELYENVTEILQTKLNLRSRMESYNQRRDFATLLKENVIGNSWKTIRREDIREILLEDYLERSNQANLQLLYTLKTTLAFKFIEQVELENGKIARLDCNPTIPLLPPPHQPLCTTSGVADKLVFPDLWLKYIT